MRSPQTRSNESEETDEKRKEVPNCVDCVDIICGTQGWGGEKSGTSNSNWMIKNIINAYLVE